MLAFKWWKPARRHGSHQRAGEPLRDGDGTEKPAKSGDEIIKDGKLAGI